MERGKASEPKMFAGSPIPEIPVFSGEDAYLWVSRVEQYFHTNPTNDRDKLRAATAALQGRAFDWFLRWNRCTAAASTWPSFKEAVVHRFQPEAADNPFGVLLNLRQKGTVAEYRELFETLTHSEPLRNLVSDEISSAVFANGLRAELRGELGLYKSASLSDLMHTAQLIEERRNRAAVDFGGPRPMINPMMKFLGEIAGKKVMILVATGAANSQIAKGLVEELRLPVCETDDFFEFGNESVVNGEGVCRGVAVKVQDDVEIIHDFFVFDQLGGGEDVVLGCDWLEGLEDVAINLGDLTMEFDVAVNLDLTMKFKVAGMAVTLKGDSPPTALDDESRFSFLSRVNINKSLYSRSSN